MDSRSVAVAALVALLGCKRHDADRAAHAKPVGSEVPDALADAPSTGVRVLFRAPPMDEHTDRFTCVARGGRLACALQGALVEARSVQGPVNKYPVGLETNLPVFDIDDDSVVFRRFNNGSWDLLRARKSDGAEMVIATLPTWGIESLFIADGRVFVAETHNPHFYMTHLADIISLDLAKAGSKPRLEVSGHRPDNVVVEGTNVAFVQRTPLGSTIFISSGTRPLREIKASEAGWPLELAVHAGFLYWCDGSSLLRTPMATPGPIETIASTASPAYEAFTFDGQAIVVGERGSLYRVAIEGDRTPKFIARTETEALPIVRVPDGFLVADANSIRGVRVAQ